jgi:hypothetical protein
MTFVTLHVLGALREYCGGVNNSPCRPTVRATLGISSSIDATLNLRVGSFTAIGGTSTRQTVADSVPWRRPNTILTPRFFRITVETDF